MSSKDEHIAALEDEIRAARETIKSLTKAIEELSKNRGNTTIIRDRTWPYTTYPYWWDGRTWYYQTPTITYSGTLTATSGTINTYTWTNRDDDDGDGVNVSNVA